MQTLAKKFIKRVLPSEKSSETYITPTIFHGGSRKHPFERDYFFSSEKRIAACFGENATWWNKLWIERTRLAFENPMIVDALNNE